MNYSNLLTIIQLIWASLWIIKVVFHFSYLKSVDDNYRDKDIVAFFRNRDFSDIPERLYVNSPFFFFSKSNLSKNQLRLAKRARLVTLLFWVIMIILFVYLYYLQTVLKIEFGGRYKHH